MDNGTDGCNFLRLLGLRKKKTPPSVEEEQPLEQESSVDQNESTKGTYLPFIIFLIGEIQKLPITPKQFREGHYPLRHPMPVPDVDPPSGCPPPAVHAICGNLPED